MNQEEFQKGYCICSNCLRCSICGDDIISGPEALVLTFMKEVCIDNMPQNDEILNVIHICHDCAYKLAIETIVSGIIPSLLNKK